MPPKEFTCFWCIEQHRLLQLKIMTTIKHKVEIMREKKFKSGAFQGFVEHISMKAFQGNYLPVIWALKSIDYSNGPSSNNMDALR